MTVAIDLQNVRKQYKLYPSHMSMALDWSGFYKARFWAPPPEFPIKRALHDISVQINRGDRVGIIGRNGAGKTTLLKLAAGMVAPTAGKIRVNGQVQVLMRLGAAFHPDFSGAENIRHSLLYNGAHGKALDKAFDDVADFVELGDFLHQPMRTYSMGMATRLQFAVATAITPDILIIDEVLGAGDAYFAAKSADRMRSLTKSGCTLLLVSHARAQIMEFCTSALWLDNGMVRAHGDVVETTAAYDKAIAEAIGGAEKNQTVTAGFLPIPGHLRHPDYLRRIRDAVDALGNALTWNDTDIAGAQMVGVSTAGQGQMITSVDIATDDGPANHVATGDALKMRLYINSKTPSDNPVICRVMAFAHGGDLIAMTCSQPLALGVGVQPVDLDIRQMQLGHRDCLLAVTVEQDGQTQAALAGIYLKIMETNDSDPPLLHYPAKWYQNTGLPPAPARISGIQ